MTSQYPKDFKEIRSSCFSKTRNQLGTVNDFLPKYFLYSSIYCKKERKLSLRDIRLYIASKNECTFKFALYSWIACVPRDPVSNPTLENDTS